MTDSEIPAGLIQAKRDFYDAERRLGEMPTTDTDAWRAAFERQAELAVAVHRHPAFEGLSQMQRYELDTAASKAARAGA